MSQKVQIYKNTNKKSKAYGKYYVRAVYDNRFITTAELADFIQTQASVKRSDCKAVLDELGGALKHFFELGQKVKLDNIGIFKVGITSAGDSNFSSATAGLVRKCHVIFTPEVDSVMTGESALLTRAGGGLYMVPVYNHPAKMLKDVRFELAQNSLGSGVTASSGGTSGGSTNGGDNTGGDTGGDTGDDTGGDNTEGGQPAPERP